MPDRDYLREARETVATGWPRRNERGTPALGEDEHPMGFIMAAAMFVAVVERQDVTQAEAVAILDGLLAQAETQPSQPSGGSPQSGSGTV